MNKSAGLFAETLHPGKHVGKEVAEYVRSFGHKGFIHSDESIKIDWAKIRRSLKAKKTDLIILAAGSADIISLVKERVRQMSKGVSEDTRRANADCSTSFMRPLPTGARMYPETDILPFALPRVESLETPQERLSRLEKLLPAQIARKLYKSPDYHLFERIGPSRILGKIITEHLPALRRQGINPSERHIDQVVRLYKSKEIPGEGITDSLTALASGRELKIQRIDAKEVHRFVADLVRSRKDYIDSVSDPVKGLMGPVMAKYRGKVPGGLIFKIIKEELEK